MHSAWHTPPASTHLPDRRKQRALARLECGKHSCVGMQDLTWGSSGACLPFRVEQMLEGLKMGWVFRKPAGLACPSDDSEDGLNTVEHGLNTVSPLLGELVLIMYIRTDQVCAFLGVGSCCMSRCRLSCFACANLYSLQHRIPCYLSLCRCFSLRLAVTCWVVQQGMNDKHIHGSLQTASL